jgi:hypothetical protein
LQSLSLVASPQKPEILPMLRRSHVICVPLLVAPVSMFPPVAMDFSIGMERTASIRNLIEVGIDEQLKLVGND